MGKFYAVRKGRKTGIFTSWPEAQAQVIHFSGCQFKSFTSKPEAESYLSEGASSVGVGKRKRLLESLPWIGDANVDSEAPSPSQAPTTEAQRLPIKKQKLSEATGFGSANNRTKRQAALAKQEAEKLIASFDENAVIIFTDGACSGNPGPCGAGAVIKFPGENKRTAYAALGTRGTNNIGELYAVGMAMDMLLKRTKDVHFKCDWGTIHILTDSKYSAGVLMHGWKATKNIQLIEQVKDKLAAVQLNYSVSIHWIAGHTDLQGNEMADCLANMGVRDSNRNENIVDYESHSNMFDGYILN